MVRKLSGTLCLVCLVTSASAHLAAEQDILGPTAAKPATPTLDLPPKLDLFHAGEDGYTGFRIPGVVVTTKGTVLCYCAARKSGFGDWDDIDVALRRSTDGGKTFSAKTIIADVGTSTVDNPTAIVDRKTDAVHMLYQVNYARCYYIRSDDDGQTWSEPHEITGTFEQFRKEYGWNVIAPGPGHGIQLSSGRLLVPVWLSTGGKKHRPSCVATVYSDDQGRTWQRGQIVVRHSAEVVNPSETIALELADGRVMLNIRNETENRRRLISYSRDGATGWTKPVYDDELFEPVCMASIARLSDAKTGDRNRILFANPNSEHIPDDRFGWCRARRNLSVRMSYDEGRTWPVLRVVEPGIAGYSDMAVGPDGTVYLFYERGGLKNQQFHTEALTLARFDLGWLIGDPKVQLRAIRVVLPSMEK